MSKKSTTKKPVTSEFSITLTIGKDVYQGTGKTALEALQSLPKPAKIMGKGVVRVENEGKFKEILMIPLRLRRLFYNKIFQEIQVKWLTSGLK